MNLRCECENETEFLETTLVSFTVDAEGNREEKVVEETTYGCRECGQSVEICE